MARERTPYPEEGGAAGIDRDIGRDTRRTTLWLVDRRDGAVEIPAFRYPGFVASRTPEMMSAYDRMKLVADTNSTVLLLGETGTGKELSARAVHHASKRHKDPFLAVNCGALPRDLIESELFGHVRGSFTGAVRNSAGVFRKAQGGTVFLDEIGELPLEVQVKLLRVLDQRTVRPVGGLQEIPVDIRFIVATNCDLTTMVAEGRFREDLFYRLNVISIHLPPLRDYHPDDFVDLSNMLLGEISEEYQKPLPVFDPAVTYRLRQHHWPGNIRELRNVLERIVLLCEREVGPRDLPSFPRGWMSSTPSDIASSMRALAEMALTCFDRTGDDRNVLHFLRELRREMIRVLREGPDGRTVRTSEVARRLGVHRRTIS